MVACIKAAGHGTASSEQGICGELLLPDNLEWDHPRDCILLLATVLVHQAISGAA